MNEQAEVAQANFGSVLNAYLAATQQIADVATAIRALALPLQKYREAAGIQLPIEEEDDDEQARLHKDEVMGALMGRMLAFQEKQFCSLREQNRHIGEQRRLQRAAGPERPCDVDG